MSLRVGDVLVALVWLLLLAVSVEVWLPKASKLWLGMAYVVGDACIKCKYTSCVPVCPVDCFYEGENALVIHPEECIHCGACEPECPAKAIYPEDELPGVWKPFRHLNALFSGYESSHEVDRTGFPESVLAIIENDALQIWPNIAKQKAPLPNADAEALREHKIDELSPYPYSGR